MIVRHPSLDEVVAAAEVLNAHARALHGLDDITPDELEEAWRAPEVEFPADVFVAEHDGRLVGYVDIIPFGETSWIDVRATDAEAYAPLLEAALPRAEAHGRKHVRAFAGETDADAHKAIEESGFRAMRYGFRMAIDLDDAIPEPTWPDGFIVRRYRDGDARRSTVDTRRRSPTRGISRLSHSSRGRTGSWASPSSLSTGSRSKLTATWRRSRSAASPRRRSTPAGSGSSASCRPIGGAGLALALLRHVFRHFADQGMKRVVLGVDAENPTGAVVLYERAGMSILRRNVTYERVSG